MSTPATPEASADSDADQERTDDIESTAAAGDAATGSPQAAGLKGRLKRAIRRGLMSAAVFYLYVPHLAMLRLLGPRLGTRLARVFAWFHWLLTFVGAQSGARRALAAIAPYVDAKVSPRTMLRKFLENKHQCFTEMRLRETPRGRAYISQAYYRFDGQEHLDAALSSGRGAVAMVYHIGMYQTMRSALELAFDYEQIAEAIARSAHYAQDTSPTVARLAMRIAVDKDDQTADNKVYITPGKPPLGLVRKVRQGYLVGLAGDGVLADEFVEASFLGGRMKFATGPARIAALCRAPLVPMFCFTDSIHRHRMIAHPPLECRDRSREEAERVVLHCTALLEGYVRQTPWAWQIWPRLEVNSGADGTMRIEVRRKQTDQYHQ